MNSLNELQYRELDPTFRIEIEILGIEILESNWWVQVLVSLSLFEVLTVNFRDREYISGDALIPNNNARDSDYCTQYCYTSSLVKLKHLCSWVTYFQIYEARYNPSQHEKEIKTITSWSTLLKVKLKLSVLNILTSFNSGTYTLLRCRFFDTQFLLCSSKKPET